VQVVASFGTYAFCYCSKLKYVFVPSHSGLISAVGAQTGEVNWQYKISNAMINPVLVSKKIVLL